MRWSDMQGGDRVRSCSACEKNVYDLSALTREEANTFLAARVGEALCVRLFQRADGTVMTADCSVGAKAADGGRRRRRHLAVLAASVMATAAGVVGCGPSRDARVPAPETEVAGGTFVSGLPARGVEPRAADAGADASMGR
jgi:hypothetical protein